jgi:hypothetical protein
MNFFLRRAQAHALACLTLAALTLAGCGGGGGGGSTTSSGASIEVTPALGGFSAGATVSAFQPDGTLIDEGLTSSEGKASIAMGSYSGPFILKVVGGSGVTYFDEKSGQPQSFAATDSLLSIVPVSSVTSGASYGITPITHLAAAIAGVDANSVSLEGDSTAVLAAMNQAVTRTQDILGLDSDSLDILAAPTPVRSATDTIDPSSKAALYGLLLAEMAFNSSDNALNQAKRFFTAGRAAKSNNFSAASVSQLDGALAALKAASNTLASGSAEFLKPGSTLAFSPDATKQISTIFASASGSGSGTGGSSASAARTIRIVPGLGRFSANARVELLAADDGVALLTPVNTDANGVATFDISGLTSVEPFIVRVTGRTGVSYFDEGLGAAEPFASDDVLLSIVPATSLVAGSSFGVTPLTHMAASLAGVSASASGSISVPVAASALEGLTDADAIQQVYVTAMVQALSRVRWALGYKPEKNVSNIFRLDPLVAPDLLSSATDKVDLAASGGLNGYLLLELAKATRSQSSRSAYAFTELLGVAALDIKTNNFSDAKLTAFENSPLLREMKAAVSAMAGGLGTGSASGVTLCIPDVEKAALQTFFEEAGDSVKIKPTDAELSEMGVTVSRALATHVRATVFPFEKPTSCAQ